MKIQKSLISSKQFFTLICLLPFHQLVTAGEAVSSYKIDVDTTFMLPNVETTKIKLTAKVIIGKGIKKWVYHDYRITHDSMLQDVDITVENKKLGGSFSLKSCDTYRPLKAALAESFSLVYTADGGRRGTYKFALLPKSDPALAANIKYIAGVAIQAVSGMLIKYKKAKEVRDTTSELRFVGLCPVHYRGPIKNDDFSYSTKYYMTSCQNPFWEGFNDEKIVSKVCNRQFNYTDHTSTGKTEAKLNKDGNFTIISKTLNDVFKFVPFKEKQEDVLTMEEKLSLKMLDTSPGIFIPPFKMDKTTDDMVNLRYTDVNKCIFNYEGDIYNLNRMYKALACNRVILNFGLAVLEQATFCLNRRNKKGLPVKVSASGSAKV